MLKYAGIMNFWEEQIDGVFLVESSFGLEVLS